MSLVLTFAVVAVLFAAQEAPRQPLGHTGTRLLLVTVGMLVVVLTARIISGWTTLRLERDYGQRGRFLARFAQLRHVHLAIWLAVGAAVYALLDWPQMVRGDLGLADAVLLDELLILAPLLLPLALSWAAFYDVERLVEARRGGPAENGLTADGRLAYVLARTRNELGLLLAPLFCVVLYQDMLRTLAPGHMISDSWIGYLPPFALVVLLFPLLLRWTWRAEPLPGSPLRERLEACSRRMGVTVREILVWPTGRRMVNAAVCGLTPRWRFVFLTDGLLAHLSDDEVEAIHAHELAHVARRHMPLRIAALVAPLCLLHLLAARAGYDLNAAPWLMFAAGIGWFATGFAWYCRLLEHEADLGAALACSGPVLDHEGIERFAAALDHVAHAGRMGRGSRWGLHPAIDARLAWLRTLPGRPSAARRFQRRLRLLAAAWWCLTTIATVLAVVA